MFKAVFFEHVDFTYFVVRRCIYLYIVCYTSIATCMHILFAGTSTSDYSIVEALLIQGLSSS